MKDFIEGILFNRENNLNVCRVRQDGAWVKKHHLNDFNKIIDSTSYLPISSFSQRIYHIYNDIKEIPTCGHCSKVLKFRGFSVGYGLFCSCICAQIHEETQQKIKNTCLEKYGVENYSSTDEYKQRIKNTCLERYGVDHVWKAEEVREKQKATMVERYGVDNPSKSEKIRQKTKNTCLERYGVDHVWKAEEVRDKQKVTCLERYGEEHQLRSQQTKQKIKNTCLERYGVDHVWGVSETI